MFDVSVRTLCDVRHIPYFKKNVILLGILDCNEFSFKSEGGVLKMSKSDMTVMRGKHCWEIFIDCWVPQS